MQQNSCLGDSDYTDTLEHDLNYENEIDDTVNELEFIEIKTISSLSKKLDSYKERIKEVIEQVFDEKTSLRFDISIYYLVLLILARDTNSSELISKLKDIQVHIDYEENEGDKKFIDVLIEIGNK